MRIFITEEKETRFRVIKQNKQNPFFLVFVFFSQSFLTRASTHLVPTLSTAPCSSSPPRRNEPRLLGRLSVSSLRSPSLSPKEIGSRKPLSDQESFQLRLPSNRRPDVSPILQKELFSLQSYKSYEQRREYGSGGWTILGHKIQARKRYTKCGYIW